MWLTCTILTMLVLPPSPGLGGSSPWLQTAASAATLPCPPDGSGAGHAARGPAPVASSSQAGAAAWVSCSQAQLTNSGFQNSSTVPPPEAQAQPQGELISVGKEPRPVVTQSPFGCRDNGSYTQPYWELQSLL